MAIDLNADMGEILKGIFSSGKKSRDTSSSTVADEKRLSSSGLVILFPILLLVLLVADLFFLYLPAQDALQKDLEKGRKIEGMIAEEAGLVLKNRITGRDLQEAIESKKKLTSLMFANREIDTLYSGIHDLAKRHSLEIDELKKEGGEPVSSEEEKSDGRKRESSEENILFYRLRLSLNMKGDYLDYIRMREGLLDFGKMINVDDEKIISDLKLPQGFVKIEMKLSAYQI